MKSAGLFLSTAFVLLSTMAMADDPRAGTKGHVTAYEEDKKTVIDVDACPRTRGSWDYVSCGRLFREKVKNNLCRTRGRGTHRWYYQVGDAQSFVLIQAVCK